MRLRVPWLTIAVFGVTAMVTTAQFFMPELLPVLRRQPSMLTQGEIWRFVTAWLVHDEGLKQIGFNFPLLAAAGSVAEFTFDRRAWIAAYVLAGLTGEVAGLVWQPIGAGNSVAILGLVGLVAAWWSQRPNMPRLAGVLTLVCLGAVAIGLTVILDIHGPALLVGLLFAQIVVRSPFLVRAAK